MASTRLRLRLRPSPTTTAALRFMGHLLLIARPASHDTTPALARTPWPQSQKHMFAVGPLLSPGGLRLLAGPGPAGPERTFKFGSRSVQAAGKDSSEPTIIGRSRTAAMAISM